MFIVFAMHASFLGIFGGSERDGDAEEAVEFDTAVQYRLVVVVMIVVCRKVRTSEAQCSLLY